MLFKEDSELIRNEAINDLYEMNKNLEEYRMECEISIENEKLKNLQL